MVFNPTVPDTVPPPALSQDAFKLQAAMLRECAAYKPSTSAVQATLKWAFADVEDAAARQTAFSLLKVRQWHAYMP